MGVTSAVPTPVKILLFISVLLLWGLSAPVLTASCFAIEIRKSKRWLIGNRHLIILHPLTHTDPAQLNHMCFWVLSRIALRKFLLPLGSLRQSNGYYSILPEGSLMQYRSNFGACPFCFHRLCIALVQLLMTQRILYLNEVILLFWFLIVKYFLGILTKKSQLYYDLLGQ